MKSQAVIFDPITPHPEPVSIASLLTDIEATIKKHVVLNDHAAAALAVWILHTWTFELRDIVAYVAIESPEKRCGKTTLLSVLAAMAHKPLIASNVTVGALFRAIDTCRPTLFIDEADTFLAGNSIMRGIINSGNTWRTAYVLRLTKSKPNHEGRPSSLAPIGGEGWGEGAASKPSTLQNFKPSDGDSPSPGGEGRGEGELHKHATNFSVSGFSQPSTIINQLADHQPTETGLKKYSCWCPKVIAMIGQVPDTIADRSIVVPMTRKLVSEPCAPLAELNTTEIKSKCARFALDNHDTISQSPKIRGEGLNDRAADTFDPLYVIARLAGAGWEEKLHAAAIALNTAAQINNSGAEFILDILSIFVLSGRERIFSRDLAQTLREGGCGLRSLALKYASFNEYRISQILRPYGIKPRTIRVGKEVNKGYAAEDFKEVLERYIPQDQIAAHVQEIHQRMDLQTEAAAEAKKEEVLIEQVMAAAPKHRVMSMPETLALIKKIQKDGPAAGNDNVTGCCHLVAENVAT